MPSLALCFLVVLVGAWQTKEAPSRVVADAWNAAYLGKDHVGYVRTLTKAYEIGDTTIYHTNQELHLTVKREQDTIRLHMETGGEETSDGRVTGVYVKQELGKDQRMTIVGKVVGNRLLAKIDEGKRGERDQPWDTSAVGLYKQERLFKEKQIQPGVKFSFKSYEPVVNYLMTYNVEAKEKEVVQLHNTRRRLLRVEQTPEPLITDNKPVSLPKITLWLDDDYVPLRSEMEVPGLGVMVLLRSTREFAQRPVVTNSKSIGLDYLVPIQRRIESPYDRPMATYRITVKDDPNASMAFVADDRQKVLHPNGSVFELRVEAKRRPTPNLKSLDPGDEYGKSSYFINSDDERVRAHAAAAVGNRTDPWSKALAIERYVHVKMQNKNFTEAFATADQVAKTLEGDCSEHAMLAAAMARAAGIPSKTALGLVYVDHRNRGPCFGFHMWAEVFVENQWMPIDATLGRGFVGATHIKVTDHSWHEVQSQTPTLLLLRVLGKIKIEVVEIERAKPLRP